MKASERQQCDPQFATRRHSITPLESVDRSRT
jgi:hypothetical protein